MHHFSDGVSGVQTEAMALGINVDPVLERTGWEIGRVLAPWSMTLTFHRWSIPCMNSGRCMDLVR